MGAGHDHAHALGTGAARSQAVRPGDKRHARLWFAVVLLSCFIVVEIAGGLWTGSLALMSDAGHMFTDVLGISMALAAIGAAARAARPGGGDPQRTFGLYRLEVLAALGNAVLLSAVAVWVLAEAAQRIGDPPKVLVGPMLAVAVAGLLVNLVAVLVLRPGARDDLNLRGAYLEAAGDLIGSVGVIVAGVVIATTGWGYADPIVAVGVGAFILPRTWRLGRAAVRILVQAAPEHVDVPAVEATLAAVPGVCDVHDLHIWTLASGMEVASAHLTLDPHADVGGVLAAARRTLQATFDIQHATLQIEPAGASGACEPAGW